MNWFEYRQQPSGPARNILDGKVVLNWVNEEGLPGSP